MPFVLKLRDVIVGRSDLATRDRTLHIARGDFRPGVGWELVEPIFTMLGVHGGDDRSEEQRDRYRRARDTLALALYNAAGTLVDSSRIDIRRDGSSPSGLVLEIKVVDDTFWIS